MCNSKHNTCITEGCNRYTGKYFYCSITCACYDGAFSVKTGWNDEVLARRRKENPLRDKEYNCNIPHTGRKKEVCASNPTTKHEKL